MKEFEERMEKYNNEKKPENENFPNRKQTQKYTAPPPPPPHPCHSPVFDSLCSEEEEEGRIIHHKRT